MDLKELTRNAALVAVGTGTGQFLVVVSTPLLARLYGPQQFGELALLLTITNLAFAVGCFRYELAIASCDAQEVSSLMTLCGICTAVLAVMVLMLGLLPWQSIGSDAATAVFSNPWIPAITVLGVGGFLAATSVASRQGRFSVHAVLRICHGAFFSASAFVPSVGLLWAQAIGYLFGISAWHQQYRNGALGMDLTRVARKYSNFPLMSLPGALLDIAAYSSAIWIVTEYYGLENSGQLSQVQRLVGAPLMLLGIGLAQAVLKQAAELHREGHSLGPMLSRMSGILVLMLAICVALIALFGEPLLGWFLGAGWRVDAYFVSTISVAVMVRASVSPLSSMLVAMGHLKVIAGWQAAYFVSSISTLLLAASNLSFDNFLAVYAVHELIMYAIYWSLIFKFTRR